METILAMVKANIAALQTKIAAQEKIVANLKAELDAAMK